MALTAIEILNAIRDNLATDYSERVPEATKNNIAEIGKAITSDSLTMNDFINELVNKVAFTHIVSRMFKNPLARVKNTGVPMGNGIEEIFINPATDVGFDTDGTKLLKTTKPDGKTCYYGLNRKGCYPVTISEQQLVQAFRSEQSFMSLYQQIVTSMQSGDEIDEFLLMKKALGMTVDNGSIKIVDCDISEPKELSKAISSISKSFSFPSTAYCGYNIVNADKFTDSDRECITFCRPERQTLFMRADAQTEIDYEVLATMFHMEVAKLEAMTILVDDIPSDRYEVYAILCDNDFLQVRDSVYKTESQHIGSALSWNFWLHHWEYIYCSMFGNAVAFAKERKLLTLDRQQNRGLNE